MRRDGVSPPRDGAALTRRRSKQALDPSAAALIRPLSTFSQGLVAEWVRRHGSLEEDPQKADMWRVCGMMYKIHKCVKREERNNFQYHYIQSDSTCESC